MTQRNIQPIRVAIAGLGRSGWGIHAKAIDELPQHYQVVAVSDFDKERQAEATARFGCRAHDTFESLIQDDKADLVVVATPNPLHVQHTIAAVEAGRHVVCEKPLASNVEEIRRVEAVAGNTDRVIAPFQNRRFEPLFRKIVEVVESGVLGRIVQIRVNVHGFSRRWDWQTLRELGGGLLNNHGPHAIDQLLVLFGDAEPEIFCRMDRALASGDAEDHVKIIMHAPGAPIIDLELTNACAYGQPKWLVMGTQGGLQSEGGGLKWRHVDFSTMPERPVDRRPTAGRTYNNEELTWEEHTWEEAKDDNTPTPERLFYEDVYSAIRDGQPLTVTLQSVARQIAILETCHATSGFHV